MEANYGDKTAKVIVAPEPQPTVQEEPVVTEQPTMQEPEQLTAVKNEKRLP